MIILGLGSNIGDRLAHLDAAASALGSFLADIKRSPVYSCPAVLPLGAPKEWDMPYYNMAISGQCALSPEELLVKVKEIEQQLGRQARGYWGPREIDIDILAMDDLVLKTPHLYIPHRGLLERDFALVPFADVAPHWRYPGQSRTVREICVFKAYKLERVA